MIRNIKKETLIDFIIVLLIVGVSSFCLFSNSIAAYNEQDLSFHLNRFVGLANAFEERQILPKIYPYGNNEYGYASPLFYCDLFLYPFAILYHFGVSVVVCYKLCVIFYSILCGLFIYTIIKKETSDRILALFSILIYLGTNYHLQNLLFRSALGEVLAMTFIPLVLHSIYKILIKHEGSWIYLGVSFALLVMSHLISSLLYGLFFLVMIIILIIINRSDKKLIKKTLLTILKGTLLAILLTLWYLLPMFEQLSSQRFWVNVNSNMFGIAYETQSLLDVFRYIAIDNNINIVRYASVGLGIILLSVLSIFVRPNKYINIIFGFSIALILIIIGIIPANYLNIIQFYFRLYIVVFPLLCIVCIYGLYNLKDNTKKYVLAIFSLIILINIIISNINVLNSDYLINDNSSIEDINNLKFTTQDNLDYNRNELGGGEYLPYTEVVDYINDSKAIKYLDNNGNYVDYIYEYDRSFSTIIFNCDSNESLELMIPLSYYKGYKAYELNGDKWEEINLSFSEKYKQLIINSNIGSNTYKVTYKGTIIQNVSLIVSSLSLVLLIVYKFKNV